MNEHLLFVDDDPELRQLLRDYLERNGYRISTVADGREMWRQLEQSRIDLIVLDLMLPGDDGLVLCRNLRARSAIPVIMLTARSETTDRIIGLEMGADDYLAKPFDRSIDMQVSRLRRRLNDDPHEPAMIKTVRAEGYMLAVAVSGDAC